MTRFITSLALGLGLTASAASAATITALNDTSLVIAAPGSVTDDSVGDNETVFAFAEATRVVLTSDLAVAGGTIAAGTAVDSHMIFLNRADPDRIRASVDYAFGFSTDILGVITSTSAVRATNDLLGAVGTTYGLLNGFERSDTLSVMSNSVSGNLIVTQPGDWFRVVTVAEVPVPAAGFMLLAGLGAMAAARRGRR